MTEMFGDVSLCSLVKSHCLH